MSFGHSIIRVICDRLTKYTHFVALPSQFTAPRLTTYFSIKICRLHGMPKTIVPDRDPLFVSTFWRELFKAHGTTLKFSSAYPPQTDGQIEVLNPGLEAYLRYFAENHPKKWYQYLHLAKILHNSSYHSVISTSLFHVLYGRPPPTTLDMLHTPRTGTTIVELLHHLTLVIHALKENLHRRRQRMCDQANRHCSNRVFAPND